MSAHQKKHPFDFKTQYGLGFNQQDDEIVVDFFCGGGGAGTGLEMGLGRAVTVAKNHSAAAISMHTVNHPHAKHFTTDVFEGDPDTECGGRAVGWFHMSPDCTHHSQAAGGQPRKREIRNLSWIGLKWAGMKQPRVISLENVKQILQWGPLVAKRCKSTGRVIKLGGVIAEPGEVVPVSEQFLVPDPKRRGQTWAVFVAERNSALITGVPIRQEVRHEPRYFNGITAVGQGDGVYLKQKLVPFGEYVPLQDVLRGLIAFFDLPMSDFARGPADQAMLQAKGYQIAPLICYEVVYPDFVAGLAAQSDILLTISNDTWFGTSIGPLQHLQMAQMRALEAGRWMIRATNNGVTALIDPFGQITTQIPQFEQAIMYGEVVPMHNLTPYLQWRSWPLIILCSLLIGWALVTSRIAKTV